VTTVLFPQHLRPLPKTSHLHVRSSMIHAIHMKWHAVGLNYMQLIRVTECVTWRNRSGCPNGIQRRESCLQTPLLYTFLMFFFKFL